MMGPTHALSGALAWLAAVPLLQSAEVMQGHAVQLSAGQRAAGTVVCAGAAMLPEGRVALILRPGELVEAAHGDQSQRGVAAAFAPPPAAARKRILLADDSLTTRALERSILEAAGYEVIAVADGAEAWQQLQAQGADLLVADVQMPRMDGFMLTETVRGARRFRDLPVVLVTGQPYVDKDSAKKDESVVKIAEQFDRSGALVVAGMGSTGGNLVSVVRGDPVLSQTISTVDNANTVQGQLGTSLALAQQLTEKKTGQYGVGDNATSRVPTLPR